MAKYLLDKLGFNSFHDLGNPWQLANVEYTTKYCLDAGVKYIRPAFALQQGEFDGTYNNWREQPFKYFIAQGLKVVLNLYPQEIKGHLLDDNANDLVDQAVKAYTMVIDGLLKAGISASDFIIEAWNEADGGFAAKREDAQSNPTIINRYLTFNMKMCKVCNDRGVEFWDFDSVVYPNAPEIQKVMNQYDSMVPTYTGKPDRITFHPYCERDRNDNNIPEHYLINFNLTNFKNLHNWGVPIAISELGYPAEEWGHPFSGKYPTHYAFSMLQRQIMIHDYMGIDPMVIYSANTNPPQDKDDGDASWGMLSYTDDEGVHYSPLGIKMLWWLQSMKGYYQTGFNSTLDNSNMANPSVNEADYANYWCEYSNDEGHKKLFYWCPYGNNTSTINWNGQSYKLKFNQFVQCIEADTAQPDTPDSNAPLNLTACYTDKAKYQASDTATVNLEFDNQANNMRSLTVAIDGNTPTGDTVSLTTVAINIPAGKSKSSVSFKIPSQDNTSYLLQVAVLENDIPQATQTIGLDVGNSWTSTPRYGALTNFNPNDQTSKDNISDDIATLNKFNINATMYYDGYYRPQNTIPSDNYQTWIGEDVSKGLLQKGVDTNHQYGMQAMLYNMINATTGTPDDNDTAMSNSDLFGSTITRQDGTKGIASKMGVYRTGKCNECPVPGTFDGLGEQATYNMLGSFNDRDDVDHKVQYYYNPADPDWQSYIGSIMKNSLALIGFDGWQGDTIGDIYGVPYEDKGTNNNGFHTMDTYASFINAVKPAYFADKTLGMNAVNYGGQDKLNSSKADFNYAELWQSNEPTYEDLAQCIRTTASVSNKPLIVPSYMYRDWYNSGSSDFPSQFKDATILIKDAVIFANGGAPMELADNGYQLPTEYYPDTRTHYKIVMSDTLGDSDNGLLRKMYDFVTAYSSLLYPANHTKNLIYITDSNGNHVNSSTADAGKVYDITTNQNGVDVLQLVNLTGCSNSNWQINNKSDEDSKNITPTGQLTIKMYTNNTGTLYGASYKDGMRNEYSYTTSSDSNGSYITFTIDSLDLWSIFYITK